MAVDDALPPEPPEPPEHEPKRWEEFYKYSLAMYDRVQQRWTQADDKAAKYLQILTATLAGLGFVGFTQVAKIFAKRSDWLDYVFLLSFSGAVLCGLAAFFCFLFALQYRPVTAPPSDPGVLQLFSGYRYLNVLRSFGDKMLEATEKNRISLDEKISRTRAGFWLTVATAVFLAPASLTYFAIQVRIARMPPDAPQVAPALAPTPSLVLPPVSAPPAAPVRAVPGARGVPPNGR